ncbi:MAG TPA: SCO family protein [Solirubrobacteraceae bacterium]|jgi:protein SCO1/2|nr:SCO family protein [Solirubrobacteraceae bacterium]
MRPLTRMALALLAGLLLLALILVLVVPGPAGRSGTASPGAGAGAQFDGAALPTTLAAPSFSLLDEGGRRVTLRAQRGGVTVLTFLYSHCGGPCIVIAEQIRGALDELGRPPHVLIVSADPSTDTRASVRRFLAQVSLTGRVSYLTGAPARLRRIWRDYRVTPAAAGVTAFARAAFVLLIDPSGHERVLFGPEQLTPEGLAHDIGRLQGG